MLHPSYIELIDTVNKDVPEGEPPIVQSRYSIVLGTAKRARQLTAANSFERDGEQKKALSIAVDELWNGEIKILSEQSENYEDYEDSEDGRV